MRETNYFKMLEISPDASEKQIQQAIQTKQSQWNRGRSSRRHVYELYRKQLDDIKEVMLFPGNPTFRAMSEAWLADKRKEINQIRRR